MARHRKHSPWGAVALIGGLAAGAVGVLVYAGRAEAKPLPPPEPTPPSPTPPVPPAPQVISNEDMLPGQVWSMVFLVNPTKPWTDYKMLQSVEDAITTALARAGLSVIDGEWGGGDSGTHQFAVAVTPARTIKLSTEKSRTIPIQSEWADYITIMRAARAPASPP